MTMITPSYLGETIEYSSLHACRSTLEDPMHSRPGSLRAERLEFHAIGESRVRNRGRVDQGHLRRRRHCLRQSRARNSRRLAMDVPDRARGRRDRRDPFRLSTRFGRAARGLPGRPSPVSQGTNLFRLSCGAAHAPKMKAVEASNSHQILQRSEMTRCAKSGLMHRSKSGAVSRRMVSATTFGSSAAIRS